MLIDSHCHLDRVGLKPYGGDFGRFMAETESAGIGRMLCVSIDLESYPRMRQLVEPFPQVSVSVGVHPNEKGRREPLPGELALLAQDPRVVAIGETGLDYYRSSGDLDWQHRRFCHHVAAARECSKPLIIHTRSAAADTLRILREEGAEAVGGVMHCFSENWEVAQQALDLGFYISLSGIVTYPGTEDLREVAVRVPLNRLLVETDCPYLTPVPHRGRPNEPKYVAAVAAHIAELRGIDPQALENATSANFMSLFRPQPV